MQEPLIQGLLQEFRILLSRDRTTNIEKSKKEFLGDADDESVCSFVIRIGEMRLSEEFSPMPWESGDVDRQQFHRILDQFRATLMRIESIKETVMDICRGQDEKVGSLKFEVFATVFGRKSMEHAHWIIHQLQSNDFPRQHDVAVEEEERGLILGNMMPRILPIQTIKLTRKTNVTCLIEFIHTKIEKPKVN